MSHSPPRVLPPVVDPAPNEPPSGDDLLLGDRVSQAVFWNSVMFPVGLEFRIRSLNRGLGHHCVAPEF